ncbi:MAG TPA: cupin domain-containing protein [Nitrolancea sp.]|nr:cupin domain-containing protein [Nitrolancea sp.]
MAMTEITTGTYVAPNEGERIRIFDEELVIKVEGRETAGAYALITLSVAPGGGPPLHAHPGNETFYVLSGDIAFTQRDAGGVSTVRGGSGTVFHAPGGVPHRFENVSPSRSTMLLVVSADSVEFLRELGSVFPPGAQPDMEKMLAIHARYAVETFHGAEGSRPEPPKDGAMSAQARALAWRFEQANATLIEMIATCSAAQWQARCTDTGWTVAVEAHHVASNEPAITGLIRDGAAGHPHPPAPAARLDEINARHAVEFARVTIAETTDLLRKNGVEAANLIRKLTDEQLTRPAVVAEGHTVASVADMIERLAIGEIERHGDAIRTAIGD